MNERTDEYVSAEEAAGIIGVKRETLYAYVSRGLLESVPDPDSSRSKLYRRADLERLRSRAAARAGEGAVAAGALQWGAPVLDTAICEVKVDGPRYRGMPVSRLVSEHVAFERVAELLWSGTLPDDVVWEMTDVAARDWVSGRPLDVIRQAALHQELEDSTRVVPGAQAAVRHARSLMSSTVGALAQSNSNALDASGTFAAKVALALGAEPRPEVFSAINTTLVVCAEHELNASAFAARVAASTGANIYAAVTAALAVFVGPRHGGMDARILRLLEDVSRDGARQALIDRLQAGETVPGFGQLPVYRHGDPRFGLLWEAAREVGLPEDFALVELVEVAAELAVPPPNLDLGLAAVSAACSLPAGSTSALFAIGRTAGWVAHALEQAEAGFLLRPRARYVGPEEGDGPA